MPGSTVPTSMSGDVSELYKRLRRLEDAVLSSSSVTLPAKDSATVASTPATTYTLTALPLTSDLGSSLQVFCNGVALREGADWSCDYSTGVVTVTFTLTAGDELEFDYWTTGELVAASLPAEGSTYANTVAADSLIYWRFTETSGTAVADASGHGYDGTISGTAVRGERSLLWTDDDPAVLFGNNVGDGYSVVAHDAALETAAESVMFYWDKNANPAATIYQHDNRSRITTSGSADLNYWVWGGTDWVLLGTAAGILANGVHSYLVTYDGTAVSFLKDGAAVSTVSAATPLPAGLGSVRFGAYLATIWTYTMDEFALFGHVVDAATFASYFALANGPLRRSAGASFCSIGAPALPTDTASGDLGLLVIAAVVGTEPATLNGWTLVDTAPYTATDGSYTYGVSLYKKTLSGSGDTLPATIASNSACTLVVLAAGAVLDEHDFAYGAGSVSPTAVALAAGVTALRVWFAVHGTGGQINNGDETWGRELSFVTGGTAGMNLSQDSGHHAITNDASDASQDWIVTTLGVS